MTKLQIALPTLALVILALEARPAAAVTRSQCYRIYEICSASCPEASARLHHMCLLERCAPIVVACMSAATGLGGPSGAVVHPAIHPPPKNKAVFTPVPPSRKPPMGRPPGLK
jgi:hypothetical protein